MKTGSKDAVDNILTLLNKLKDDETAAQATDDANWATESQDCVDTSASLEADISAANAQIDENNNNINLLQTSVTNDQASLDEANNNLATQTASLQNLEDERTAGHAAFLENTATIASTIAALQQGKEILSQLLVAEPADSGSFMQKKQNVNVFSQFTEHITAAKLKKGKYYGFVMALLSMLNKDIVADQALVNQVIDLIDQLIDQLSDHLTTLASDEKDAQDIFETKETNLNSEIGSLNSEIADLQSSLTTTNAQILDLQSDNSSLEVTVQNKSQELTDRVQTCTDDENAYTTTQAQRFIIYLFDNDILNFFF